MTACVFVWAGRSQEQDQAAEYTLLSLIHALSTDGTDTRPGMQTYTLLPSPRLFSFQGTASGLRFLLSAVLPC